MTSKKKVIVIGVGFGGLQVIKTLGNDPNFEVIGIDRTNHHLFQPLLYQVATAVLSPADIAIPTRSITTDYKNVKIFMAKVEHINFDSKTISFSGREETFDYLVIATGAQTSYFGNADWQKYTYGLKNLKDALNLRRRILMSFEEAELSGNIDVAKRLLNYVIIGGGPTGVELAGSIAELSRYSMRRDFRLIDPAMTKVTLIEAGPRLLSNFATSLSDFTKKSLEDRGVEVLVNSPVQSIDEKGLDLKDRRINTQTIIWAAGVEASSFSQSLSFEKDKTGRIIVDEYCRVKNQKDIFAIGDTANFSYQLNRPLPGVSPVAMQQGRYVGHYLRQQSRPSLLKPFQYFDKGNMATIGKNDAIAEIGKLKLKGFIGWIGWLFVHLVYQVGFKNKVSTLISWIWSYVTVRRGARLIQEDISNT
ncbi:NADH dehydrogenase [Leptospira ryugenii]|uniref:NADH:ubiquinone reductase (non-electrogenic) n=1 Tax=Leptospira ryugenii TaxID=1917863 RepID=A0A2P2E4V0_9LEPT|nr:NAD(P)/FAD-dependent oxidoreductase [Leptospira ryugenii]GBF51911.1 NADH dehydrogenase [Leptospira ryugenii]